MAIRPQIGKEEVICQDLEDLMAEDRTEDHREV